MTSLSSATDAVWFELTHAATVIPMIPTLDTQECLSDGNTRRKSKHWQSGSRPRSWAPEKKNTAQRIADVELAEPAPHDGAHA